MSRHKAAILSLPVACMALAANADDTTATKTTTTEQAPVENTDSHTTDGLIADLALILLLGAVVTILFKRLKQPVVLGYILAGFLASPNFEWLPSIHNMANIHFWAELGIVVLMFTLGLEFSFKKLVSSGASAILTAFIIICGMTFTGFWVGQLLDFNFTNSIFLGGMLSMSSTTIILKAFTDLGLRQKKFASLVLAVLIIEDLFAVLMLVLLSSLAMGDVQGSELAFSIAKLLFYLILWYIIGVWFLPTIFTRFRKFMNSETLLVVSMGLCFGMAWVSVMCGFSLELGSFIGGSIIAGTVMAERIERVVQPVKDLFGAVFFISVGMMVEPSVIAEHWPVILLLAAVVITGMIIFGTGGMLLTGQSLKVAMESGFSLTQIGEFSFIIASLGMSLGVLNDSLYPIIVAVSVITIFTTPYFINLSGPAYRFTEKHLPRGLRFLINRYSANAAPTSDSSIQHLWKKIVTRYVWRLVLYSVLLFTIMICSKQFLMPLLDASLSNFWGHFASTVITLLAMSPFLVALTIASASRNERERLQKAGAISEVPLVVMHVFRYIVAIYFIASTIAMAYSLSIGLLGVAVVIVLYAIAASGRLRDRYRGMERKFLENLNQREDARTGKANPVTGDLHQAFIEVDASTPFVGDRISDTDLRRDYGVSISSIQRGMHTIPLPNKDTRIFPGDVLGVIGTDEQIQRLNSDIESYRKTFESLPVTETETELRSIRLTKHSPLVGKALRDSGIREKYLSMLVRASDSRGEDLLLRPDLVFEPGMTLWLVGEKKELSKLTGEVKP